MIEITRPVSTANRFLALSSCAPDAPGKFAVVKIPFAGSLVSTPKFIVGTYCWFWSQTSVRVQEPPVWMLCDPFIQLRVFSTTLVDASRAE